MDFRGLQKIKFWKIENYDPITVENCFTSSPGYTSLNLNYPDECKAWNKRGRCPLAG